MTLNILKRTALVSVMLLAGAGYLAHASRAEATPTRQPLELLPLTMEGWQGRRAADFDARVMSVLGVDDYINRVYHSGNNGVGLYVGYWRSQRQGDSIHSPLNCLPGAGWQPTDASRVTISLPTTTGSRSIEVNRIVIEKGDDKQVVLYWYQSHGRVVASEYWSKFYLVADAARLNRTDAALVRVITPVNRHDGSELAAEERGVAFVRTLFPLLDRHLPD